jgi:hypothetical protein
MVGLPYKQQMKKKEEKKDTSSKGSESKQT